MENAVLQLIYEIVIHGKQKNVLFEKKSYLWSDPV